MTKPRVLLLTRDNYDGRLFLKTLSTASSIEFIGVVYEKMKFSYKTRVKAALQGLPFEMRGKNFISRAVQDMNKEVDWIAAAKPDWIVVAGTRKLHKEVYAAARVGALNVHTGILPEYRGADSEFWALYEGESGKVGITLHSLAEELDAGDILYQEIQTLQTNDNYKKLHERNLRLAANRILDVLQDKPRNSKKQESAKSRTFLSALPDLKKFLEQNKQGDDAIYKVFGSGDMQVSEIVAKTPSIYFRQKSVLRSPNTFCLRIDADEYHEPLYSRCLEVFKKYKDAVTIFYNAHSFSQAPTVVREAFDSGIDVQSHAYYHATYGDYESNRQNIHKAREFFKSLGIEVKGFAAPTGRCNRTLHEALIDEKQLYSSDFSYDYLGYPSAPQKKGKPMDLLQIPVFPVAPELFLEKGIKDVQKIIQYYKDAMDEMIRCGIPVFIYGHTSHYKEMPFIYEQVCEYALNQKELKPMNMTRFYYGWKEGSLDSAPKKIELPRAEFMGEPAALSVGQKLAFKIKKSIDFEMITPLEECHGNFFKIFLKRLARLRNRWAVRQSAGIYAQR